MSIKAFAVAAVFGASAALAGDCPESAGLPIDYDSLGWKDQAMARHAYMDSCPKDGVVSYRELKRYNEEVEKSLIYPKNSSDGFDQVYVQFMRIDDDGNKQVSLEEYIRHAQNMEEPIDHTADKDDIFKYLSCKPQKDDSQSANCQISYDRNDLRAVAPLIMDFNFLGGLESVE